MKHTLLKTLACILLLLALTLTVCACDNANESETTADTATEELTTAAPTEEESEAPTEEEPTEEETEDNGLVTYKVTVVDAAGNPVANVPVQLCQGEICRLPIPTNAEGVALIEAAADDYSAKALYNGGETESYDFGDATELTIVLPD